jgi:CheY-like chemotaxis protein
MKEHCTILWAEDDEDDIMLICEAADILNITHLIDFAGNGKEVLIKLEQSVINKRLPQLIVLDHNLPIMTGFEVLQFIQANQELCNIPIAFFTTGTDGKAIQQIQGQVHIFKKPAEYSAFLSTLKAIMELCVT